MKQTKTKQKILLSDKELTKTETVLYTLMEKKGRGKKNREEKKQLPWNQRVGL